MYHRKSGWQFHLRFCIIPCCWQIRGSRCFIKFPENIINANVPLCYLAIKHRSSIKSYYKTYATIIKVRPTPFISEALCFPDSTKPSFPRQKNLLVIFMESMETNFSPYTPELNRREQKHYIFPGGANVSGTGWTIPAQIAKLCGIPLMLPKTE